MHPSIYVPNQDRCGFKFSKNTENCPKNEEGYQPRIEQNLNFKNPLKMVFQKISLKNQNIAKNLI